MYLKARCKEAADKEKDVCPAPTNKGAEFAVGIDIKMDEIEEMEMKANVSGEHLNMAALTKFTSFACALC